MFCKCENIQKWNLLNVLRVRCCRSVLTFWNRLWIRSWCLISGWVIEVLSNDICCFYFKRTVSPSFPLLLLCVQRKRTAHERAKDLFASGEFSSGRKWADDAPKEKLDSNTVNLIASGACGAFVHGLEDEMFGTWNTVPKWCNFLTSPFFTSLFYDFMLSDLSLLMLFQRSVLRQWRRSASSLGRLRASLKSVWTSWSTCSTMRSRKWGWSPSTCWEKSPHI